MKQIFVLFLFISFSFNINAQSKINYTELNEYIENAIKEWKIPGLAISIVNNDSVVFMHGFGVREVNKPEKVDENTMFGIASLSKGFTSTAIGILVDQGKINLDDKVRKYLPYFELYDSYVSSEMTIRDLLCHRSGLKTFSGDLLWYASDYSRKEIIERAKYLIPEYSFRTNYGYSNIMFLTAGEIIPVVSGESWDNFIYGNIFKPLKMKYSNTSITKNLSDNIATPHVNIDNKPSPIKYINWDNIAPAGAINSCVKDMTRWISMLLNNGKSNNIQVISENSLNELWQSHTSHNVTKSDNMLYPSLHFHSSGLGWDLFDFHGKKIINHSGGLDGMVSHICIVPEEKFGFVILTNSSNYLPDALMYKILDMYFGSKGHDYSKIYYNFFKQNEESKQTQKTENEKNRIMNTKPTLALEKYSGTYKSKLYGNAEVTIENKKLFIKLIPTPNFYSSLTHWQDNTFKIKWEKFPSLPEGTAHFIINSNSEVEELRIDVPNPDFDFTELKLFKQ